MKFSRVQCLGVAALTTLHVVQGLNSKPNIIFILADDMGYNDAFSDDFAVFSPFLSSLKSSEGMELTNYYSQALCTPSRSALLTGRYPFKTGMQTSTVGDLETWGNPTTLSILPQLLKKQGYKTHLIGKWHLGHAYTSMLPQNRGYDDVYGVLTGGANYKTHVATDAKCIDFTQATKTNSTCVTTTGFSTKLQTDRAISIAKSWDGTTPMLLSLHYQNPHSPLTDYDQNIDYSPVQSSLDAITDSGRKTVARLVYDLDQEVKRLYTTLTSKGILNNYIIAFASDNGGCTTTGTSNYPLRGAKSSLFEGGTRVRAFIGGSSLPTGTYSNLFHVTDWLPTLMSAVGGTADSSWDGVSHWSALASGGGTAPRTEMVYNIEAFKSSSGGAGVKGAIRQGDYKYIQNEACYKWYDFNGRSSGDSGTCGSNLISSECEQTTPIFSENSAYLFNLKDDPNETNDLSTNAEYTSTLNTLKDRLATLASSAVTALSRNSDADTSAIDLFATHGCVYPWKG